MARDGHRAYVIQEISVDTCYIRNWFVWVDLYPKLRTFSVVARGRGPIERETPAGLKL